MADLAPPKFALYSRWRRACQSLSDLKELLYGLDGSAVTTARDLAALLDLEIKLAQASHLEGKLRTELFGRGLAESADAASHQREK